MASKLSCLRVDTWDPHSKPETVKLSPERACEGVLGLELGLEYWKTLGDVLLAEQTQAAEGKDRHPAQSQSQGLNRQRPPSGEGSHVTTCRGCYERH